MMFVVDEGDVKELMHLSKRVGHVVPGVSSFMHGLGGWVASNLD